MQDTNLIWNAVIALSSVVSLFVVRWAYFKILKIAKDKNLVDNPDARKLQKMPVPVMGGIAVFFGVVAGVMAGAAFGNIFDLTSISHLAPIWLAMAVMLYVGAMDDIIGLTPGSRFIIEILSLLGVIFASGSCIDSFHGLWGVESFSWWVAVPLTVVAGVGIINAVNMIDGVNGLSSGMCMTCCIIYGVVFRLSGDMANALLAFVMAAALLPFLLHNVFGLHSRMFIGDAGTMVMGVLMTWFTINVLESGSVTAANIGLPEANMIALALAVLSVPVFDTVRVMTMRILKHQSPFNPDKTHLHHIFINLGVSHSFTALFEIAIGILIVGAWLLAAKNGASSEWQLYIVIICAVILVWGTYFFLRNQVRRHTRLMHRMARFSVTTHHNSKNWWLRLQLFLDRREIKDKESEAKPKNTQVFHITIDPNPENKKEVDRRRMLEYMKGKAELYVDDIKRRSGADRLRVDALLFEGEMEGYIHVITRSTLGSAEIVALDENVTF